MAITIQPPRPGDLITSRFMLDLIDQLNLLDARLTALEGVTPGSDGKLHIIRIIPTDVVPGDTIQIFGVNFGLPSDNIVTFDGGNSVVPIGGNDTMLTVIVPTIDLGGSTARSVTVGVSGGLRGFDSDTITVHTIQATIPAGTISVSPGLIPANILPNGNTYTFPFTIEARVNLDETYVLTPSVPTANPAWSAIVSLDAQGTQPITQPLPIPKPPTGQQASTAQVFVRVTIPSSVTNPFVKLDVRSVHNPPPNAGSPSGNGQANFQFNQAQQPPQTIRFVISSFTGQNVAGNTSMVQFPLPTPTQPPINGINYLFQGLQAGQYQMTLQWGNTQNNNQGWQASFGGAPNITPNWPVMSQTITMNAPGDWSQKIAVVANTGALPNTLTITIRNVANPTNDYGILPQGISAA